MAGSKIDREWIEGKRGITNRSGEYITLQKLGDKIKKFKEDIEAAKNGTYIPRVESPEPAKKTTVQEFLDSLDK